jgi:hypothetical protein
MEEDNSKSKHTVKILARNSLNQGSYDPGFRRDLVHQVLLCTIFHDNL